MYRRNLIPILLGQPWSLDQLALELELSPRELSDDLRHLLRSLRHSDYEAVITPARCRKCGFAFGEEKLRKPGKCPRCHGTWISPPVMEIRCRN